MLERLEPEVKEFFRNYDRYKKFVNFFGNIILLLLAVYIISDVEGFKQSVLCKAYQPVIEVAQQCTYGVRSDLCYQPTPLYNFSLVNQSRPWNLLVVNPSLKPPIG